MKNETFKGFLFAIIAASLWGISGTFGQFLFQQRGINVEWMITVRMLISGFLLLIYAASQKENKIFEICNNKKDFNRLLLFSITGMLMVQYTYFAAIKHSNAATATILQYAGPVLITIYLAFKNKKIPRFIDFIAISFAVLGTFLLVTHGKLDSLNISTTALFLGLGSAVALAIYTLQPIALLQKYNSATVIGWGMLIGGLAFSFIKAPWSIEGLWDDTTYLYTAFIVVFGTLIPFYLYLTAVQIIGGQKSSLLASAEPFSATIIAILWLNVSFGMIDWIGSLLIISTIFLLSYEKKPKPENVES
ncbi:Threonine/homoserine efflux transporter RhtA [Soonwooa buanensis]|uniref:Threonine/homoserine efflux transporter RhtA n=1 Tax=Soonwooa buanensis TaxID=619805 RepID=A0A1T5CMR4_9FLAO|nr:EamA family transporter [Soonwooa buanensis]SKB60621.1 Threonine/homoserine efflux transporter RhtA [Soonwooa buanensis]